MRPEHAAYNKADDDVRRVAKANLRKVRFSDAKVKEPFKADGPTTINGPFDALRFTLAQG